MTISHHPDEATLMAFSAGTLSEPFALLVAAHRELCRACRDSARMLDAIGGTMLEDGSGASMPATAFESLMARTADRIEPAGGRLPQLPMRHDGLPSPLARLVGGGVEVIRWRRVVAGVEDRRIRFPGGKHTLRFLRAQPGKSLPEHGHEGAEMTLVLRGALRDGPIVYGAGDVADLDEGVEHNPAVDGAETCICVIANEGATHFKQLRYRVLQRLIGI